MGAYEPYSSRLAEDVASNSKCLLRFAMDSEVYLPNIFKASSPELLMALQIFPRMNV